MKEVVVYSVALVAIAIAASIMVGLLAEWIISRRMKKPDPEDYTYRATWTLQSDEEIKSRFGVRDMTDAEIKARFAKTMSKPQVEVTLHDETFIQMEDLHNIEK